MFCMGDEVRRTQLGNNNAYCHDDPSNWLDWSLLEKHADVHRFVKLLMARRALRDTAPERRRVSLTHLLSAGTKDWHGVRLNQPDWADHSHSIALRVQFKKDRTLVYFIFNAYWEPLEFELPSAAKDGRYSWRRWIDTFLEAPQDIVPWQEAPLLSQRTYPAGPRSVVVLWASPA